MKTARLASARRGRPDLAQVVFLALLVAMAGQSAWYYPRLPALVASHFGVSGHADSYMPKQEFMRLHLGVVGLISLVLLVVPMLVVRLPPGMINLPNKDYWLAPERRAHTGRVIRGFLTSFGDAMLLFLLVIFGDAMRASLLPAPRLSNRVWVMLILLASFAVIWTIRFVRAFRRPD